ncbi:hypothetical protein HFP89_01985 [Wenzhouxiangella sp. XN79A]|uniref:hypothetical protein n=1 Tax=Wenzhouxiangella sp. XN79A TaxID=2724193 RepID=UPI00144AF17C|nr:hypothetical protein [Wenzhouxiangella sp. XN79A]NKI33934.1 hypothetical protein [Wenzhouxiangella sp. XN79A]
MVARLRLSLLGGLVALGTASSGAVAQDEDDLFARVFGNRSQTPAAIELDVDLMLQGVILGSVGARIEGPDLVDIDREALLEVLRTVLAEERLAALHSAEPRIDPARLARFGIDLAYDPVALAVRLDVPPEYRIEWQVPIAPQRPPAAGRTRYDAATVSAGLNLLPSLVHDSDRNRLDAAVTADGFFNVRGWAIQGEGAWSEATGRVRRGPFRLHRDFVGHRVRLTVGELRSPAFGQQPALPLRGISFGRVFSIDPYDPPFPGLIAPLLLEAPTEVEVTVDGRLVERVRLPAGPTLLSEFPLRAGLNDVRIDLYRDGLLHRQLDLFGWFDRTRLGAGRQEFHVSIGQPWLQGADRPRLQHDEAWFSAAIRRGINARWTSGVGLLADSASGDAVVDWSNDIGFARWSLNSGLAVSRDRRPGTAGTISLQQEPGRGRIWSLRMGLGWRDDAFRPFGIETAPGRELRGEFALFRPLGDRLRWSGTLRLADREAGLQGRFSSVLSWRPNRAWSVQLRGTAQQGAGPDDLGLTLTLDWQPRRGKHALTAEFDNDGNWLGGWRYNSQSAGSGHGASVFIQDSGGSQDVRGSASFRNHRIRAGLDHRWSIGDNARTRLAAQTALVFADGRFGLGDRVGDGFVVFAGRPGTGRVEVNPDDDEARSRSGLLGPAVVGDLTPYLERGFTIGLPEVPIQSDPGDLQPVARAGFLQGVVVPVGPVPGAALRFAVHDADGQPLVLSVGELVPADGGEPYVFFSNRTGQVELGGIPPGRYHLRVSAIGLDRPIEIPATPAVQPLGVISP